MTEAAAAGLLQRQLKQMQSDKDIPGISCGLDGDNIFDWNVMLMISDDCKFYGGGSCVNPNAKLRSLPQDIDLKSAYRRLLSRSAGLSLHVPSFATKDDVQDTHLSSQWFVFFLQSGNHHETESQRSSLATLTQLVYESGDVCISILHPPVDDPYGYERVSERWSPVQTPETILLSVISMLSSPNDESPANVEAARLWRDDPKEFKKRCRANVRASLGEE